MTQILSDPVQSESEVRRYIGIQGLNTSHFKYFVHINMMYPKLFLQCCSLIRQCLGLVLLFFYHFMRTRTPHRVSFSLFVFRFPDFDMVSGVV